ncbi:MAG: ATP-binding cassette domain-containing protein [Oscillospiraceae bacterium]|nr:ATP-binding cassette domain-containing protein [Oscillospiraceae bacterium]
MVEMKNVNVRYSSGVDALVDVNLRINDGEFVFIVGENGAGKSTLMKLMMREIVPSSGRVFVNGYNLSKLKGNKIAKFRRSIGVVFQEFRLIQDFTVYENVAYVLRIADQSVRYIRQRVPYVLNLVELNTKAKNKTKELSGGEQQRVAIARALANDPGILIVDEPTGNLDPRHSMELVNLLKGINRCGTTVIMITHEHELVQQFGGRIINVDKGSITFDRVIGGSDEDE